MHEPLSPTDTAFLHQAVRLAHDHMKAGAGGPFGAVVACDADLLAAGWNQVTSTHDPTAHAEVVALRAAAKRLGTHVLTGCTLYTSCEPCPMCLAAAYWARVERIVFAATRDDAALAGFDDAMLYRELSLDLGDRQLPMVQGLRSEAQAVFAAWLDKADRVPY